MRIGILTHPLKTNYGGILQNYALQAVLRRMGYDVKTINVGKKFDTFGWFYNLLKYPVKKILKPNIEPPLTKKQTAFIEQHIDSFIHNHISVTEPLKRIRKNIIDKYNFETIIVGSDQVWRPNYVSNIQNMFLDFLGDTQIRRIAFAASFGVDHWSFLKKQEEICAKEAQKFKAISVREASGVYLCEKHLNVKAEQIMDPTILLSKEEYLDLLDNTNGQENNKKQLTVYILDLTKDNQDVINEIANKYNLRIIHINNHDSNNPTVKYKKRIVPPIEDWIAGFHNAEYIITDSFHGTIFSIIFNKPFITLANKTRGLTRITSVLDRFRLENQLVTTGTEIINIDFLFSIDFSYANKILEEEKLKAIRFLKNNLN
ncbi:MAG: polysaccharide pyruvyl transferase family protein [Lentimicrobium sp.]